MANPATAIFRQIKYKEEVTYGLIPSLSGAQALRRVEFSPELMKDTYQSNEIRTDQQIADFRHGARRAEGTLRGELSPGAYSPLLAALVRKDFVATTALSGLSVTIAGTVGSYTVTRSAGDFLSGGIRVGDVVRLAGAGLAPANAGKNLLVTAATATVLTVTSLNGSTLTPEGPVAAVTLSVPGKRSWVPLTNHTSKSFTVESWFSDLLQSEMYTGMKPRVARFALPSTGMATLEIEFGGQNVQTYSSEQFTSPVAAPTFGVAAAVNGLLRVGSATMTTVRDLSIAINGNVSASPVVGSNVMPFQFPGRVVVDGQFTAYFDSVVNRDAFIGETELSLAVVLTSNNADAADFVSLVLPRIKVGSASKNDAADGIVQTFQFQALLNTANVAAEQTTVVIQDSQA